MFGNGSGLSRRPAGRPGGDGTADVLTVDDEEASGAT